MSMPTPYETIIGFLDDDVKRPDKVANGELDRRIQRAVVKFHRKDFFKKDLIEQPYIFSEGSGVIQILDLSKLIRCRSVAYIRKWSTLDLNNNIIQDPTTLQQGTLNNGDFEEVSALDRLVDGYGYDKQNVMYRSGNTIRLNSSVPIDRVMVGYFTDPLIEPVANINSWIPTEYPNLISAEVSYRIKKSIGEETEANDFKQEREEEWMTLLSNNILVKAH